MVVHLRGQGIIIEDTATEMYSLISMGMMKTQSSRGQWQHLTHKDKGAASTTKDNREVLQPECLVPQDLWWSLFDQCP